MLWGCITSFNFYSNPGLLPSAPGSLVETRVFCNALPRLCAPGVGGQAAGCWGSFPGKAGGWDSGSGVGMASVCHNQTEWPH